MATCKKQCSRPVKKVISLKWRCYSNHRFGVMKNRLLLKTASNLHCNDGIDFLCYWLTLKNINSIFNRGVIKRHVRSIIGKFNGHLSGVCERHC